MLSDADLRVTDLYNLRHERGIAPKPGMIVPLPIPTTFLVDGEGIVRWIDCARDYQVRSQPDRVRNAIEEMLPDRTSS